jgi:hypothetical protein
LLSDRCVTAANMCTLSINSSLKLWSLYNCTAGKLRAVCHVQQYSNNTAIIWWCDMVFQYTLRENIIVCMSIRRKVIMRQLYIFNPLFSLWMIGGIDLQWISKRTWFSFCHKVCVYKSTSIIAAIYTYNVLSLPKLRMTYLVYRHMYHL